MSAQGVQIITVLIPNLQFDRRPQAVTLNATSGFRYVTTDAISTLNNKNPNDLAALRGLLYVPNVPESACSNETLSMIPSNVTRIEDLPYTRWAPLAIAPWTTPDCVQAFLSSMRADAVGAAFFFHPDGGESQPPQLNDQSWNLNDGGQWQGENQFPIYALPGGPSQNILQQLSLYSGNITSAPLGTELAEEYNENDSLRIAAQVDISNSPQIPSLWVFLIIVLGILLVIVLSTSVVMHLIQRRQRNRLAQRVARGEVDLEALGIKRLNVPQTLIDKMPTYTYTSSDPRTATAAAGNTTAATEAPYRPTPFSQSLCPICLDDFVHNETPVRELPCNHIFHPECIDPFLRDNSSLCPMCKASTLPKGYCPVNVTNIMVRRERLVRRMRARASGEEGLVAAIDAEAGHGVLRYQLMRVRDRVRGQRAARAGLHQSARTGARLDQQEGTELQSATASATSAAVTAVQPPPSAPSAAAVTSSGANGEVVRQPRRNTEFEEVPEEIRAQGASARRAWLRERLARREARRFEEQQQQEGLGRANSEERRPAWRRAIGRVFPGFS